MLSRSILSEDTADAKEARTTDRKRSSYAFICIALTQIGAVYRTVFNTFSLLLCKCSQDSSVLVMF